METITAYRVGDKTFDNLQEAEKHEAQLELASLIESEVPYSDYKSAVHTFLRDNGPQVRELLTRIYHP